MKDFYEFAKDAPFLTFFLFSITVSGIVSIIASICSLFTK